MRNSVTFASLLATLIVLNISMLFTSCSEKEVLDVNNSDAIAFTPAIGTSTKATPTTTLSLDNFTVEALNIISPSGATSTTYGTNYFKTNVSNSSGAWETAETYYWPNNALGFFAYAGLTAGTGSGTAGVPDSAGSRASGVPDLSADAEQGSVTISNTEQKIADFSPAKKIEEQKDVIVAYNEGESANFGNGTTPVDLFFKHILSQVEVQAYCANPNIKVEVIGLKLGNIRSKGSFTFPTTKTDKTADLIDSWSGLSATDKSDYVIDFASSYPIVNREATAATKEFSSLMGDESSLATNGSWMLIPQAVEKWNSGAASSSEGAYLAIKCKITSRPSESADFTTEGTKLFPDPATSSEEYGWTAVPLKIEWKAGMKYIYKLELCGDGGGAGVDPTDPNKPVLGGPIKFVEVDVQPWSPADEIQIPEIKHEAKLELVSTPSAYTYVGGTQTATIKSIDKISSKDGAQSRTEPLPWTVKFFDKSGKEIAQPEWLEMPTSGQGGEGEEVEIKVLPQKNTIELNKFNKPLGDAEIVGSKENPVDLSDNKKINSKETANCYIINGPGYYKLPLIIGNGRSKDGTLKNPSELKKSADYLHSFVNYKGEELKTPQDYEIKGPANCTLLWQDVDNLVSEVKLSEPSDVDPQTGVRFLKFYVDPATILTGNAIVAVRDASDNIMWSWHIWATNYVPGTDDVQLKSGKSIMPLNLGWAEGQVSSYAARSVKVKFTTKTGTEVLPQEIEIKQKEYTSETGVRNTYYQWGRKDPMLPALKVANKDAEQYSKIDELKWDKKTGKVDLKTAISNPNIFYKRGSGNYDWCSITYWDLWNYEATSKDCNYKVSKTIYDPSPAGYHIPEYDTFMEYTEDNTSWIFGNETAYNSSYDGRSFESSFVPASGYRDSSSGVLGHVGDGGYYWLSTAYSASYGRYLYFSSSRVHTQYDYGGRADGFGVRSVRDF